MIVKSKTSQQNSLWGNLFVSSLATFGLVLLLASSANAARFAAPPTGTRVDLDEQKLLTLLGSNAPDAEKAVACKKLAICGTKKSVPALAPLLADERFSSWARIALEAIPGPAADQALREAMGKLEGRLLVGIINSIGYRRDAKAVSALTKRLSDPNAEVASAAAVALGRIGDSKCAKALTRALATAPTGVQSAVATGCILCAERAMAEKKSRDAIKLYETVRTANVPTQRVLEATRGAILARGTAGIPLLLEQLRSPDRALFGVGLRTARELPGAEATKAIVEELQRCSPERQPLLLLALADRNDAAALSAIVDAATGGRQQTRLVAVRVLDRMGKSSSIPVLVKIASEDNPELGEAAMSALARLGGANIDADLLARLAQASGPTRGALIQVAVRRGMANALPVILSSSADPNPKSRLATIQAIGALGQKENINDLLKLLQNAKEPKSAARWRPHWSQSAAGADRLAWASCSRWRRVAILKHASWRCTRCRLRADPRRWPASPQPRVRKTKRCRTKPSGRSRHGQTTGRKTRERLNHCSPWCGLGPRPHNRSSACVVT